MQTKNNVGFTLIELLVVVLIIGILAAVALPQYTKAVEKSRATEAMQILGDLATAESIYYMTNGAYTANAGVLDLEFPNTDTSAVSNDSISGKSYNIALTIPTDGSEFTAVATRHGGAYQGGTVKVSMNNTGAINREVDKGSLTGDTATTYEGLLNPLWKNK